MFKVGTFSFYYLVTRVSQTKSVLTRIQNTQNKAGDYNNYKQRLKKVKVDALYWVVTFVSFDWDSTNPNQLKYISEVLLSHWS